jgi:uncharacterized membrane protein YqjE
MNSSYDSRSSARQTNATQRFLGLVTQIAQHSLALLSLASLEAQDFLRQILLYLILLVTIIAALLIAYFSLLVTIMISAVNQLHCSWSLVLGMIALVHFFAALVFLMLLCRCYASSLPFEKTILEIKYDLQAFSSNSLSDANNF